MRGELRAGRREAAAGRGARSVLGRARDTAGSGGQGSREHSLRAERWELSWERTMNMLCMVVTLEVSQLEMSALK